MPKVIKFTVVAAITASLVTLFATLYDTFGATPIDGYYELSVNLYCNEGSIRGAIIQTHLNRDQVDEALSKAQNTPADEPLKYLRGRSLSSAVSDPFDGRRLKVRVIVSGHIAPLSGREQRQLRFLLVIADLSTGERVYKIADIPDCDETEETTVTIP
jgi:hypothetical protein